MLSINLFNISHNFNNVLLPKTRHRIERLESKTSVRVVNFEAPGVKPGKGYDPADVKVIDGRKSADDARKIQKEVLNIWANPEANPYVYALFKPRGETTLEPMAVQSVYGPTGLPAR
jgi:hypothetical protein